MKLRKGSVAIVVLFASVRAGAVDFLRGDVNGDGVVSMSDVHRLFSHLYRGAPAPECLKSADVDDDGFVDYHDGHLLLNFLLRSSTAPALPYPVPGPDPTENPYDPDGPVLDCLAYGSGAPIQDPAASIQILEASSPGGEQGTARIVLAISGSRTLAGFHGRMRIEGDLLGPREIQRMDSITLAAGSRRSARIQGDGSIGFYSLASVNGDTRYDPNVAPMSIVITVCLRPGTFAGAYPVSLEYAELMDWETGRAITPALDGGVLTIEKDVIATDPWCSQPTIYPDPVSTTYRIGSASVKPGDSFQLPFIIRADAPIQGFAFSIDFNEDVLQALRIEEIWKKPDGSSYDFKVWEINNQNQRPGSAGIDEGYLVGGCVVDILDPVTIPADTDNVVLAFHFLARPEATAKITAVRPRHGGLGTRPGIQTQVQNIVTVGGASRLPEEDASYVLLGGQVSVLPEISVFLRGDSNSDGRVDLSDAQNTLGFLFLGEGVLRCPDAADANDDSLVDIGDPITTLNVLFLSAGTALPPPFPEEGPDLTEDLLDCPSGAR